MDLSFVAIQALNGLASASSLFITACGLTLVFGVTRIVNFAHGSLYMVGAFTAATLVPWLLEIWFGPVSFWVGILLSALIVGVIGILIEVLLLRRIYGAPELFQLLATFGVVLVLQDLVVQVFGPQDILGPRAPGLRAPVEIFGRRFPSYELVLIAAGPVVLGLVWLAAAQDPLRHPHPRRDAGSRHGGGARRQPGAALHRHAVRRRVPRRSRRRAADPARRRQYGHGSLDHRRMLRRHGGGRHGQRAGRVSGGA